MPNTKPEPKNPRNTRKKKANTVDEKVAEWAEDLNERRRDLTKLAQGWQLLMMWLLASVV